MKKSLAIALILIISVNAVFIFGLSIPLWRVADAIQVSTGLGAKLACSGYFVSGFSQAEIVEDLAAYSPATRINNLVYDQQQQSVTADFWGLAKVTAKFRPGMGCTLELGETKQLDKVKATRLNANNTKWPAGETVLTIAPHVQQAVEQIMLQDAREGLDTRALVVAYQGVIIAESYAEGIESSTPLLGWSMGKSLTAILLGHLEHRGLVSVDETDLFDPWTQDDRAQISIEDLLHMSSGLDFDELYLPGSDSTKMLFTQHSASDYAMQSELQHLPGSEFSYASGTTNLLARLIFERVGGTPQAAYDFLYQDFFAPLELNNSWLEPDASGVFIGSSYPYMSARDWARLAQLMLNKGTLNGHRLLSEDWVERAITPNSSNNDSRYGYQFWLNNQEDNKRWPSLPATMYAMHGNRHQIVAVFPAKRLSVVRLGWSSHYPEDKRLSLIYNTVGQGEIN